MAKDPPVIEEPAVVKPTRNGNIVYKFPSIEQIRARRKDQLAHLHESHRRLHNPHEYKVGLTETLWKEKEQMLAQETI